MRKTATILLSRQPLRPCGETTWVKRAAQAVAWVRRQRFGLLCSVGTQTWEILTALASQQHTPLKLVLPGECGNDLLHLRQNLSYHFRLEPSAYELVFLSEISPNRHRRSLWRQRDTVVVDQADILIPVCLRPQGNMQTLLRNAAASGKTVVTRFQCPYQPRRTSLGYRLSSGDLNPDLERLDRSYAVHWTRSANTAWPDEPLIEYYLAVVSSRHYPRSAFETLLRIAKTRRILASCRHLPGRVRCVSFSGLKPNEILPLMRWRARYSEMSFEPYGLGVAQDVTADVGILPVRYVSRSTDPGPLPAVEPWRLQSTGTRGDWRQEAEYRHLGDFDFPRLSPDNLMLFCKTSAEAVRAQRETNLRSLPLLAPPRDKDSPYGQDGGGGPPPKR